MMGFQGFRLKNVVSRVEEVIAIAITQFSGRWYGTFQLTVENNSCLLWSVKDTGNPLKQAKLEANSCSRRDARENMRELSRLLTSDWMRKWCKFFQANRVALKSKTKTNASTVNI